MVDDANLFIISGSYNTNSGETNYILDGSDTYDPNYTPSECRNVVIKFNVEAMRAAMTIMNKNGIAISDEFKAKFKAYSDDLGSLKTKKQ